jgi:hypothetical protein
LGLVIAVVLTIVIAIIIGVVVGLKKKDSSNEYATFSVRLALH